MLITQRIFNCTDMQILILDKITQLPTCYTPFYLQSQQSCLISKQSVFWLTLYIHSLLLSANYKKNTCLAFCHIIIIIIIIISTTMFMVLSSWQSHCESSPGSFDECRTLQTDDLGVSPPVQAARNYTDHRHLLLLSPKADTHFTVPRRVEG